MFVCIPFILATVISMPMPETDPLNFVIISSTKYVDQMYHPCDVETWAIKDKETGDTKFTINTGGCRI